MTSQYPGIIGVTLNWRSVPQFDFVAANPGQSTITLSARDAYGGTTALSFTMTVTQSETRTIAEHSPAGTAVGAPVTGDSYADQEPRRSATR